MGLFGFGKKPQPTQVSIVPRATRPFDWGRLPELDLPPGEFVYIGERPDAGPVAWATEPGADLRDLWARLVTQFPQTGLWPVMGSTAGGLGGAEWRNGDLDGPAGEPGDAAAVLCDRGGVGEQDDRASSAQCRQLASGMHQPGQAVTLRAPDAIAELLLVPALRPADVPWRIGWWGSINYDLSGADLSAVLRSWEDRFGAVLTGLTLDVMLLQVASPPTAQPNIDLVAREFYSFCPDIVDQGVGELEALYPVVAGPDWGFWWD